MYIIGMGHDVVCELESHYLFCSEVVEWEATAFSVLTSVFLSSCGTVLVNSWIWIWFKREFSAFAQREDNGLSEPSQLPMLEISCEWNNHLVKVILTEFIGHEGVQSLLQEFLYGPKEFQEINW